MLLETIKIEDGEVFNLLYHQKRVDRSRKRLYNSKDILNLSAIIKPFRHKGLYRCRIIYGEELQSIEYIPYTPKQIESIHIVSSEIEYGLKYLYRDELNNLLKISEADEVIIEKNGLLTDTTIANIALYDGNRWWTPKTPLLQGTMRAKLLSKGFLHTKNIKKEDLLQYSHLALMNAMIGFKILKREVVKL
ncbi:MAG: aminotransferase class IV [Sulfurovum sp.]